MFDYVSLFQSVGGDALITKGKKLCAQDTNNTGADDAGGLSLQVIGKFIKTTDFKDIKNAKSLRNIIKALRNTADQLEEAMEESEA